METKQAAAAGDAIAAMIGQVAADANADLDRLSALIAWHERTEAQRAKRAFAAALAAAKAEMPPIVKDAEVDFTPERGKRIHYPHVTLAGIARIVDPVLAKHGLSYRFRTAQSNGAVTVTCIISHTAGHVEETPLSGAPDNTGGKNSFQALGSAVQYLMRYTLSAGFGFAAEKDDDGEAAAPRPNAAPTPARAPATDPSARLITAGELAALREKAAEAGIDEARIANGYKVASLEALTFALFRNAMAALDKKIAAQAPIAEQDAAQPTTEILGDEIPY